MTAPVKLVWISVRDPHTRKVDTGAGTGYDEDVPVGKVSLASGDPQEHGAWRWSMFGYGRHAQSPTVLRRFGSAATKDQAKADCERAYLDLIEFAPGNRQAIHDHHAALQKMDRLWSSGEGLRRAMEAERSGSS
jgi:hypothetical protein